MTGRLSFREIRAMLQARAGQLARELAPGGKENHGAWVAPNPTRADKHAGSFRIYLSGPKAGGFVDYAGVNSSFEHGGDRGDVIDLIAYTRTGRDRVAAVRWAEDWLGLSRMDPAKKKAYAETAKAKADLSQQAEKAGILKREQRARTLFESAGSVFVGKAMDYLRSRAIDLEQIRFLTDDIRFLPALEWWEGAERINGRYVPGPEFPAIVCGIRQRDGIVRAVHCTFLDQEFNRKAPVPKPKLMFGTVQGGVIRVTNAADGLALEESQLVADLAIGEGLEDCATIAEAVPGDRVWAATSLGNLGNVYADHPLVSRVMVARDNDWGKRQALRQFELAIERIESHGRPVAVVASSSGKDFNDLAKGE